MVLGRAEEGSAEEVDRREAAGTDKGDGAGR